jgi:hypothetical protein
MNKFLEIIRTCANALHKLVLSAIRIYRVFVGSFPDSKLDRRGRRSRPIWA